MRRKIVAGNWKMNTDLESALSLCDGIVSGLATWKNPNAAVILIPPFPFIVPVAEKTKEIPGIYCGAQNCSEHTKGAFTGEVSVSMIRSAGAGFVLAGHSERRTWYGETDALVHAKARLALDAGLTPIICIGETQTEREKEIHFDVIRTQLGEAMKNFNKEEARNCIIAYEPVWAIGTGLTATPAQAQEIHAFIRDLIRRNYDEATSESIPVLYGGSCNPSNAAELFSNKDVDGGLIGGASLKSEDFLSIIFSLPGNH